MVLVSHYGDRLHVPTLACNGDGTLRLSAAHEWQHEHLGCTDILYHLATGFTVTVTLGSFEGGSHGLVTFVVSGHFNAPVTRVFKLQPQLDCDYVAGINSAIQALLIDQLCVNGQWRLHAAA